MAGKTPSQLRAPFLDLLVQSGHAPEPIRTLKEDAPTGSWEPKTFKVGVLNPKNEKSSLLIEGHPSREHSFWTFKSTLDIHLSQLEHPKGVLPLDLGSQRPSKLEY